ncbi:hypothetical protein [Herbaspirillum sp. alder98]|uniref:hypothetical protein n=1 Tax=Herbaspirillum sp. alder98 TaxID=2913096 RepID=UPI001CD8E111|nr:hypothetical protein [Herbaspirillum sp. alder98]MCA1323581.1 hypothetical protein [Herbaspirillum sp. alder98]
MSALRIGLSKSGVTVLQVSRWRKPRVQVLKEAELVGPIDTAEQLKLALDAVLAGIDVRSRWVSIVLADEWAHYFSVASPANVTRLEDCKAVADLRFRRLYDLDPAQWKIEATWSASHNFLACALPRWLIETLLACGRQHGFHLTGIVPQFVGAWNQWHKRIAADSWFGLVHQNRITLCALQGKRPVDVDTLFASAHDAQNSSWLEEQLTRNALVQGREMPTRLYLCGILQPTWASASGEAFQMIPLKEPELHGVASSHGVLLAMQGHR